MTTKERMIHLYVREKFGSELEQKLPHRTTLARVRNEWFGPGGARQRYVRSAAAVESGASPVVISRPGQVVVLDTEPLPVKVLDDVLSEPITVDLTLALDAITHALVAFRLTPGSDSSVEVAMLLRDVMLPLPMRPGWGPEEAAGTGPHQKQAQQQEAPEGQRQSDQPLEGQLGERDEDGCQGERDVRHHMPCILARDLNHRLYVADSPLLRAFKIG